MASPPNLPPLPLLIQHQSGPLHSPTTGHAFISAPLPPSLSLLLLTKTAIQALRETQNPNNSTIVPGTAAVDCLIVHWGVVPAQKNNSSSSGGLAFPATTRLCEENLELVLGYMRGGGGGRGYDFVEIRFREPAANPPLGSFAVGGVAKVGSAQSPMKKERGGDQAKGGGGGFKGPSGLDYSS